MAFNLNWENIVKSKEGPWYVVIYLYRHITGGMQQTCKLKSVQVTDSIILSILPPSSASTNPSNSLWAERYRIIYNSQ